MLACTLLPLVRDILHSQKKKNLFFGSKNHVFFNQKYFSLICKILQMLKGMSGETKKYRALENRRSFFWTRKLHTEKIHVGMQEWSSVISTPWHKHDTAILLNLYDLNQISVQRGTSRSFITYCIITPSKDKTCLSINNI